METVTEGTTGLGSPGSDGSKKRVVVLLGSPHKGGATLMAARTFLDNLESFGDVRGEIVSLADYNIGVCRGCKVCFERGEERCPLKDDRDVIIEKMTESDGVVFASPNYAWHVAAIMKIFLDRIAFMFHRPRFHGKTATAIVVQGIARCGVIRKYLEFVASGLGFDVVKGTVSKTLLPMPKKAQDDMNRALAEQSSRFHAQLVRPAYQKPSLLNLLMFRMARTGIKLNVAEEHPDHRYWRDRGWFEAGYYYPVRLDPFRKALGVVSDWAGAHSSAFRVAKEA